MKSAEVLALVTGLSPALAGGSGPVVAGQPGEAIRDTVALFDRTPLVAMGELHGLNEQHAFLRQLIADPGFGRRVDAVVVEFGNARYQAVADAFVLDKRAVSRDELRQVWRNTTQSWINTWDAPIYEQFFRAVRAANQSRPRGQHAIRVVLGDPPIDWAAVKTQADAAPFFDRDGFYARTVEREVLARGQRALLIAGLYHVLRLSPQMLRSSGTAIDQIEAKAPGSVSVVMPFVGFPPSLQAAASRAGKLLVPTLLPTRGSWVGSLDTAAVLSGPPLELDDVLGATESGTLSTLVDGLLVLGDPGTFTGSVTDPSAYREPVFAAELRRRKEIFGVADDPVVGMKALLQPRDPRYFKPRQEEMARRPGPPIGLHFSEQKMKPRSDSPSRILSPQEFPMRSLLLPAALLSLTLMACGQTTPQTASTATAVDAYAQRPELQDAGSQAILEKYGNAPGLLEALREAYGERPTDLSLPDVPALTGQDLTSDRLAYVKRTGWGSVGNYNVQHAAYLGTSRPYVGLDWSRDGCSAPDGLGLGYREDFKPACYVHDFGYRNLKVFQRTDSNRKTTDEAFHTNMKAICADKSWYKRPACYSAAYAYYQGVRIGGDDSF